MKRLCKSSDKSVAELSEDILLEILHLLPTRTLVRFQCVCKHWRKCIADPSMAYSCRSQRWSPQPYMIGFFRQGRDVPHHEQIRFFFSSKKSSEVIDSSLDVLVNFLVRGFYIIASSNRFILIAEDLVNQRVYYVYNPATRQHIVVPVTQASCMKVAAIGFHCKVDDPENDVISYTIIRYEKWFVLRSSVTIESFSSKTNLWTTINLRLDVPLRVPHYRWTNLASDGVIDGVFCWRSDVDSQIILYDSVDRRFWAVQLTEEMDGHWGISCALGVSCGVLYYALYDQEEITLWYLESNIRSQDAVWVRKYVVNISNALLNLPGRFGYAYSRIKMLNIDIHSVNPHIFYLLVGGEFISYDSKKNIAELLYDNGKPYSDAEYLLISCEWHQWPRVF